MTSNPDSLQRRRYDKRIDALIKAAAVVLVFILVIVIALQVQVQRRNTALDRLDKATADATIAAQEARTASERASADLSAVIGQVQSPEARAATERTRESIRETQEAVARIEQQLCGGVCPATKGE